MNKALTIIQHNAKQIFVLYFIHFSKKAVVSSDVFNLLQYILRKQNLCKNKEVCLTYRHNRRYVISLLGIFQVIC